MKNSIKNEILFLNISSTIIILIVIFFITLNTFQKNIISNVIKRMTEYSQESQIYIINTLKKYRDENIYTKLNELSPFIADYLFRKYHFHIEIYDNRKNLLADSVITKKLYVYQDIHYAANSMKNYILKKDGNEITLFFSSPIFFENEVIGVIRFIYPMELEFGLIDNIKITLIIISLLSILAVVILNFFFSNSITTPIRKLQEETEKIANGNFNERISIKSNDEINSLVKSFNIMIEKLEHYIKSLKEEKEKQKVFIDNITHELKTPITSILGHANLLLRLKDEKDKNISINYITKEGNRLLKLVEELLYISKMNKNDFEFNFKKHNIKKVIDECVGILNPRLKKFSIIVENNIENRILLFDYEKIKEVILNILDNSIKHSKCSKITIESFLINEEYYIVLKDNGIGIKKEILENIFNPFFSKSGKTSYGLGLCITKEIMKKHNGDITIEGNNGTIVTLKFSMEWIENG
ncbi:sensor histidine kinase [Marinitoga sp. 1197]|uniref:sensor histidine kinase n=1 Tax=Marinitoga sp. 1197 TaxID=1428449 RepID=UPI0006411FEA|nr:HAMP domain-containing sensor histidine kinase [Marinitoga sp. 1197]